MILNMTIKFNGTTGRGYGKYRDYCGYTSYKPRIALYRKWAGVFNVEELVGLEDYCIDVDLSQSRYLSKYTTEDVEHMINLVMLNACIGFLDNTEDTLSELT